jgi:hypothetical protein
MPIHQIRKHFLFSCLLKWGFTVIYYHTYFFLDLGIFFSSPNLHEKAPFASEKAGWWKWKSEGIRNCGFLFPNSSYLLIPKMPEQGSRHVRNGEGSCAVFPKGMVVPYSAEPRRVEQRHPQVHWGTDSEMNHKPNSPFEMDGASARIPVASMHVEKSVSKPRRCWIHEAWLWGAEAQ